LSSKWKVFFKCWTGLTGLCASTWQRFLGRWNCQRESNWLERQERTQRSQSIIDSTIVNNWLKFNKWERPRSKSNW
jgi:hypothetical protein